MCWARPSSTQSSATPRSADADLTQLPDTELTERAGRLDELLGSYVGASLEGSA